MQWKFYELVESLLQWHFYPTCNSLYNVYHETSVPRRLFHHILRRRFSTSSASANRH